MGRQPNIKKYKAIWIHYCNFPNESKSQIAKKFETNIQFVDRAIKYFKNIKKCPTRGIKCRFWEKHRQICIKPLPKNYKP